ncbi:hypothetical protein RFI_29242 [Reticulomyxa filosa]|uniref:Uncharacterized protein n=1 Tax=Reticulomyxa filosa TaxID=46433 RepID=X6M3C4_RETFI|nr:hypothetical protein RFI_29242 [Reticulomyxa filosa]|eukprot:ETO08146.1 hypothetical protein RFI_29242 [Reticulomyxa filosa]
MSKWLGMGNKPRRGGSQSHVQSQKRMEEMESEPLLPMSYKPNATDSLMDDDENEKHNQSLSTSVENNEARMQSFLLEKALLTVQICLAITKRVHVPISNEQDLTKLYDQLGDKFLQEKRYFKLALQCYYYGKVSIDKWLQVAEHFVRDAMYAYAMTCLFSGNKLHALDASFWIQKGGEYEQQREQEEEIKSSDEKTEQTNHKRKVKGIMSLMCFMTGGISENFNSISFLNDYFNSVKANRLMMVLSYLMNKFPERLPNLLIHNVHGIATQYSKGSFNLQFLVFLIQFIQATRQKQQRSLSSSSSPQTLIHSTNQFLWEFLDACFELHLYMYMYMYIGDEQKVHENDKIILTVTLLSVFYTNTKQQLEFNDWSEQEAHVQSIWLRGLVQVLLHQKTKKDEDSEKLWYDQMFNLLTTSKDDTMALSKRIDQATIVFLLMCRLYKIEFSYEKENILDCIIRAQSLDRALLLMCMYQKCGVVTFNSLQEFVKTNLTDIIIQTKLNDVTRTQVNRLAFYVLSVYEGHGIDWVKLGDEYFKSVRYEFALHCYLFPMLIHPSLLSYRERAAYVISQRSKELEEMDSSNLSLCNLYYFSLYRFYCEYVSDRHEMIRYLVCDLLRLRRLSFSDCSWKQIVEYRSLVMRYYLSCQHVTVKSISQILNWYPLPRDANGFLQVSEQGGMTLKLKYLSDGAHYSNLNGIEIDLENGEIDLFLDGYTPKDTTVNNEKSGVFTTPDIISHMIFWQYSNIDENQPMYQVQYSPYDALQSSHWLATMLFCEYMLLSMAKNMEVSSRYPFDMRGSFKQQQQQTINAPNQDYLHGFVIRFDPIPIEIDVLDANKKLSIRINDDIHASIHAVVSNKTNPYRRVVPPNENAMAQLFTKSLRDLQTHSNIYALKTNVQTHCHSFDFEKALHRFSSKKDANNKQVLQILADTTKHEIKTTLHNLKISVLAKPLHSKNEEKSNEELIKFEEDEILQQCIEKTIKDKEKKMNQNQFELLREKWREAIRNKREEICYTLSQMFANKFECDTNAVSSSLQEYFYKNADNDALVTMLTKKMLETMERSMTKFTSMIDSLHWRDTKNLWNNDGIWIPSIINEESLKHGEPFLLNQRLNIPKNFFDKNMDKK